MSQTCTDLHRVAHSCTELHRLAKSCTELHRLAQTCTELQRVAQSCTHCTNVSPAPCTACPLAPRIPYGDNHNHCSCIGNALLNAHMRKNFITNRAQPKDPLDAPAHSRTSVLHIRHHPTCTNHFSSWQPKEKQKETERPTNISPPT